jgi:hypothetical protein
MCVTPRLNQLQSFFGTLSVLGILHRIILSVLDLRGSDFDVSIMKACWPLSSRNAQLLCGGNCGIVTLLRIETL